MRKIFTGNLVVDIDEIAEAMMYDDDEGHSKVDVLFISGATRTYTTDGMKLWDVLVKAAEDESGK